MRISKKILAPIMLGAAVFVFASCSMSITDPEAAVTKAITKVQAIESIETVSTINLDLSYGRETQKMMINTEVAAHMNPLKAMATTNADLNGKNITNTLYMDEENIYSLGVLDRTWIKTPYTSQNPSAIEREINSPEAIEMILSDLKNFKVTGNETIDGIDTIKIYGTISGDTLEKIVDIESVVAEMDLPSELTSKLSGLYSEIGDAKVEILLDGTSYLPKQIVVDVTDTMQPLINKIVGRFQNLFTEEVVINEYSLTIDVKNMNNAKNFDIPAEALNSKELSAVVNDWRNSR